MRDQQTIPLPERIPRILVRKIDGCNIPGRIIHLVKRLPGLTTIRGLKDRGARAAGKAGHGIDKTEPSQLSMTSIGHPGPAPIPGRIDHPGPGRNEKTVPAHDIAELKY